MCGQLRARAPLQWLLNEKVAGSLGNQWDSYKFGSTQEHKHNLWPLIHLCCSNVPPFYYTERVHLNWTVGCDLCDGNVSVSCYMGYHTRFVFDFVGLTSQQCFLDSLFLLTLFLFFFIHAQLIVKNRHQDASQNNTERRQSFSVTLCSSIHT